MTVQDYHPIIELGLSIKTWSVLRRNGIETIGELKSKSFSDLARMRNMGRKSIEEIGDKLGREDLKIM
ncbi:DNA-directed RNA polymerase subunit alpha [compost metagenome]